MKERYQDPWDHAVKGETDPNRRQMVFDLINREMLYAYEKHGVPRWGRHEAVAIIREELEEAWEVVKNDGSMEALRAELMQVAAMCIRYIETEPAFDLSIWMMEH